MGATVIILAGIDMFWPADRPTHCGGARAKECRMNKPEWKVEDFAGLKRVLIEHGVDMFSVSPWDTPFRSAMDYVPGGELEEYLDECAFLRNTVTEEDAGG